METCGALLWLRPGVWSDKSVLTSHKWSIATAHSNGYRALAMYHCRRAFPIQLGPGVEKAQAVVQASAELDLARVWILQVRALGYCGSTKPVQIIS